MLGIGKTDIGRRRQKNEDSILVKNEEYNGLPNLFIVADGMGGHNAGSVASQNAIKFFCEDIEKSSDVEILDRLIEAVLFANSQVYNMSMENESYSKMGTTLVAAVIKDDSTYIAHVGDSRLYKISDGEIEQITTDHSYVQELVKAGEITPEEARNHPNKNAITRAVGTNTELTVDGIICNTKAGDRLLMCSDGLSNMVEDNEILDIVAIGDIDIEKKVDILIEKANENGGIDNISVILIGVKEACGNEN